jgi:hypothetical protein
MQAIVTRYLGPTNTKGARIVAECDAGRRVVSYGHASSEPHAHAVLELLLELGWGGRWIEGGTKTGNAYVCSEYGTAPKILDSFGNVLASCGLGGSDR